MALRIHLLTIGARPTWDGYIPEAAAAELLGKSPKTLGNRRHEKGDIPFRKMKGRAGRVEYRIEDLAQWLSGAYE